MKVLAVPVALLASLSLACRDIPTVCAGLQRVYATLPETVTVKINASTIAIAGQNYGVCLGLPDDPPPRLYDWHASDSAVVAVTRIDSSHARIMGLRPGRATVTPRYQGGGYELSSILVTVVP
jgi:hypothetical protein